MSAGLDKLNTVGTGLLFNIRVVALVRSLRNGSVIVMFLSLFASLIARTIRVNVTTIETITEWKMSLSVLEESGTGRDHIRGKGELLAVKNNWASVIF